MACGRRDGATEPRSGEEMTGDAFRRLALTMPESLEAGHMGHPDFRVGELAKRVNAT
jgi:hypothetical protein